MIVDKRFENLESLYDTYVKDRVVEDVRIVDAPDENELDVLIRKQQELREDKEKLSIELINEKELEKSD